MSVRKIVLRFMRQKQCHYQRRYASFFAETITSLSGDHVPYDEVIDMLAQLRAAKIISAQRYRNLVLRHIRETS